MSIRLNKAIRELNIGLQTAVDFLEKKKLGEVKGDLNFKLSDEQYDALVEEFKSDKDVKNNAARLFQKKPKEKKPTEPKPEPKVESLVDQHRPKFKTVGKIDLNEVGKKPAEKKVEKPVEVEQPAVEEEPKKVEKEEPVVTTETVVPVEKNVVKESAVETEPATTETTEPAAEEESSQQKEETEPTASSKEIFTTKNEDKLLNATKVNVLGKIDLSSLNQSTRPKKKSKEERRKEREEKAAGERKKRERIKQGRVDINAAANQQPSGANAGGNGGGKSGGKKKKNRNRNQKPLEVSEEDVARQVKETLARLTNKQSQNKKGLKYRKEKREAIQEKMDAEARAEQRENKVLKLTEFVTVSELATMMDVSVTQVISTLMSVGIMVSINQRLDAETINLVADEFGFKTEYVSAEVQEAVSEEEDDENDLVPRAPIVTVMGHVDHGKTSLLDHIRNTNVIAGEAGGITQHIGAYNVKLSDGRRITFLDTPGHEAFTAMRARGTQVTDIAIIIIAADDSVMPTTKEAIAHAQAANVPMVFAINKIDKPGANADKIREDLSQMNLLVEEWGGKYQCQEISAKKGIGVDELLEKVLLEAEMLDLKANPNRKATGSVIESSLDKGRGYVSTLLVSNGTLKVGDNVIA